MNNKLLKVVFCLPGNSFSGKFLECWTDLFAYCINNNIKPIMSRKESCNIYYVRNMCLGADVSRGKDQKPFNGQVDYDYIMWIDSDIVFTPKQFQKLVDHNKDIISGVYMMDDGKHFATCKDWDEEYFKEHGQFKFLTLNDIEEKEVLLEVSYSGMGFMLIKKGIFESMEYPWFKPIEKKIGNMVDFTMEDVAFCLKAKEKGFKIYIDSTVRVGHEKKVVF